MLWDVSAALRAASDWLAAWQRGRHQGVVAMGLSDGNLGNNDLAGRRAALRLALGAALLPMFAPRTALAAATASVGPIVPPTSPMIYRRTLERQLPGGASLVVSRDFAVQFAPLAGGFSVIGQQVAARVDAPANIGNLAMLEQQRVEDGIFPLLLDRSGLIVDGAETPAANELARALEDVRRQLGAEGAEASTLVEALHMTGTRLSAHLPQDLFSPDPVDRVAREEIRLPWGDAGFVMTRFAALRDPTTRLMRSARREVTTQIGTDERHSAEHWELFCC